MVTGFVCPLVHELSFWTGVVSLLYSAYSAASKALGGGTANSSGLLDEALEGEYRTNQTLLSGDEWYRYLQETYDIENVNWNVSSFDDIMRHPTSLRGYTVNEIGDMLGEGWVRGTYGSNGSGWKFIEAEHPDNMIFYHGGGGVHEGAYWGIKTGEIGTVKVVDTNTYVPLPGDKATVIYGEDW